MYLDLYHNFLNVFILYVNTKIKFLKIVWLNVKYTLCFCPKMHININNLIPFKKKVVEITQLVHEPKQNKQTNKIMHLNEMQFELLAFFTSYDNIILLCFQSCGCAFFGCPYARLLYYTIQLCMYTYLYS